MKKTNLITLLQELGVRPSRRLGQNFLIDPNLLQSIARSINAQADELIIEIGPGIGNLTDFIVPSKAELMAIEYDVRLADYLQKKYRDDSKVRVLQADAARMDYEELTNGRSYRCIGNLPYSVSSVILSKILQTRNRPQSMHLLLQKETAERIQAQPGSRTYGSLSVRTQILYDVKIVRHISANLFWPTPRVESVLVSFRLKEPVLDMGLYQQFTELVKLSFAYRRKRMISNLKETYNEDILLKIILNLGFNHDVRSDQLTANHYLTIIKRYRELNANV